MRLLSLSAVEEHATCRQNNIIGHKLVSVPSFLWAQVDCSCEHCSVVVVIVLVLSLFSEEEETVVKGYYFFLVCVLEEEFSSETSDFKGALYFYLALHTTTYQ